MILKAGNLLGNVPAARAEEDVIVLLRTPHARIERIVSHAHASTPDFWYDQDAAEWVVVLSGAAGLLIEGENTARRLGPGDYLLIPAHVRHRVEWTAADQPTVWLAIHLQESL
ncbi:MAG: cupin domain-containing protein [Rhizobiales bacterium]|nr:cupin domain-containing protein [Hyphomicrobiales bacterium]